MITLIIIDLKICFSTIPLHSEDKQKFTVLVPNINNHRPLQWYQWKYLPQGMKNSPTTCQRFVDLSLQLLWQQFPDACIYHYMDDVLLAHSSPQKLAEILSSLQTYLNSQGLIIAPEKIQHMPPWKYLGFQILQKAITLLQFSFRVPEPLTILSLQQFLSHLNWIRPTLGIPTYAELPFPCGSAGKKSPAVWETWVRSLGWEDPLEKWKATHSNILA